MLIRIHFLHEFYEDLFSVSMLVTQNYRLFVSIRFFFKTNAHLFIFPEILLYCPFILHS
jgi:hypothetical protein